MHQHRHSFFYYFSWLVSGVFFGVIILLFRGDIRLELNQNVVSNPATQVIKSTPPEKLPLPEMIYIKHRGYADAVKKAAPAVVSIKTITWSEPDPENNNKDKIIQPFLGQNSPHITKQPAETGSGSGVIIKSNGYILTNFHVIEHRDEIQVRLSDGRNEIAQLIGSDPDTDLAILKINLENLPALSIANIDQLNVGDIVLAIGDPFAIGQTVTQGIISATGRTHVSKNTYENFIQTDAAINPGNSGGALINTDGEIVGINSNIFSSTGNFQGISFAIPIDLAQQVAEQIIQFGYVVRGWLGVEGQDTTPQVLRSVGLDSQHGILITGVDRNGPGDKAGLKYGDIITRINEQDIFSTNNIVNLIAAGRPGDEFMIEGIRKGQSFVTKATLGQRPMMSR